MRILHLAYEDPAKPGSGGGSVCTHEIDRRLSDRHQITAIVAGYPGARERLEDGIHWVPIGLRTGTKIDQLTYFALLTREILRRPHDLVVENSSSPFGIGFAPLITRRPVVSHVLWADTVAMRGKYHLPFDWIDGLGIRSNRDFIVISEWATERIRRVQPHAVVEVIAPGIPDMAFEACPENPLHLLFVGRLDIHNKGCDLLLESYARIRAILGNYTPPLVVAGDGSDRATVERYAARLGLSHLVEFRGRVSEAEKYQLMANAYALLMPSRYETFGMVAVEGQAVGVPVVAFSVGALPEAVGNDGAILIRPFDTDAFANAAVQLINNRAHGDNLCHKSRLWARRYNWDNIAMLHEEHYFRCVAHHPARKHR